MFVLSIACSTLLQFIVFLLFVGIDQDKPAGLSGQELFKRSTSAFSTIELPRYTLTHLKLAEGLLRPFLGLVTTSDSSDLQKM